MKRQVKQAILYPLLVAALLLAPIPSIDAPKVSAASASVANTEAGLQVVVDGKKLTLSASAFRENGTTYAPMKELFTALGGSATLEPTTKTIIGRYGNTTLSMKIGEKKAIVNGSDVKLDAAALLRNNVVFVPIRFISELFYATVTWDNATQSVVILTEAGAEQLENEQWLLEQESLTKLSPEEIVSLYDESVVMIMTNRAQGSGVVIGDDLILTNYHVMEDATSATIYSIYGDELAVTGVVAYNEQADLAIIKIEEELLLNIVEIGDGFNVDKGDIVVAIGSPLGLQNTVSEGLISNITYENSVRYLQTSAPIDSGSSGGALFNEYGELAGITTSSIPDSSADLNFAVSVYHAANLMEELTEEMYEQAAFLPATLPDTLVGAPLSELKQLMDDEFSKVQTTQGMAEFSNWEVKRDAEGWLVLTANIDPIFYMYYGLKAASELRFWTINLGHELHRMLPEDQIQVIISFERDYGFRPRGLDINEVTSLGNGKWRVKYPVIDMQLKDQLYISSRMQ